MENKKNKSLEQLLLETEQRIMNNEYRKTFTLTYDDEDYDFILTPLSQSAFIEIYSKTQDIVEVYEEIVKRCLIRENGEHYPDNLVTVLLNEMPAGFSKDVTEKVFEFSGIEVSAADVAAAQSFLAESS